MIKVIGVGDNVIDRYLHKGIMYPGGNALNFSVYAKQSGIDAGYLGVLGNDIAGKHIASVLQRLGIDISHCRFENGKNGKSSINLINGDRVISEDNHGGVSKDFPIVLNEEDLKYIKSFDVVHTSIYSYMEEEIKKIRKIGVPVSFDFSDIWDNEYLERVCPNTDFSLLSCGDLNEEEIRQLLKRIFDMGSKVVIATMGKKGAMIYNGRKFYKKKPYNLGAKVLDTLGAGDSFLTGFMLAYIEGNKNYNKATKSEIILELPQSDKTDFEDVLVEYSMARGNLLAARTCMLDGAFGYGIDLE